MQIVDVGIREAKIHLSRYLKIVKNGGEVILKERGRPVGKIVPIREEALPLPERLKQMEEQGLLGPERQTGPSLIGQPIRIPDGIAQRLLQEDRHDG